MSNEWYIEQGNDSRGPYLLAEIYDLLDQDQIKQNDWLESEGVRYDVETLRQQWPDPRQPIELELADPLETPAAEPAPSPTPAVTLAPEMKPGTSALTEPDSENILESSVSTERNCILILGRRRAGKTIYLATLYNMLWKSTGGLTMKATAGPMHALLAGIADQLKRGLWPEATLGTRQLEFELTDNGEKRVIVGCDFSGEIFHRAFVEEETETPEVIQLMNYLQRAAAVILLVDPAVAVHGTHEEIVDDDFGMVQAVQKIRKFAGGREVPITVALTKGDRNREVILSAGKKHDFIYRHYPALVRTMGNFIVFTVSAVQEIQNPDGTTHPNPESVPVNVEKPLQHCLEQIRQMRTVKRKKAARRAAAQARVAAIEAEEQAQKVYNQRVAWLVAGIVIIGLCACALIWFLRSE